MCVEKLFPLRIFYLTPSPPPMEKGGGLNYCGNVKIYKFVPPLSFNDAPTFL